MAFTPYHNIDGSTGVNVELIAPGENSGKISSIMITNTHSSNDATVTLFIQDQPDNGASKTYNLISTLAIPSSASLLLDNSELLSFDNSSNGYGLYVTVGSSDTLDLIINR